MKWSLPELAIKRPVTMLMLTVTLICLGVIARYRIPLEFVPKMDMPFIGCYIPYPGATPEQVENEIAIPAEGEFRTISHLQRIETTSDRDGCFVRMLFDWETDMNVASSEVRDRMERLKLQLPQEIDRIFLRRFTSESMPILMMSVFREENEEELAHLVRTLLQPRLMRIDGVADVMVYSQGEKNILIEFNQDDLRTHNLSIYEVVGQLQGSSINLSLGELFDGDTKCFVRAQGEFNRPEQLANLIIGPNSLRLKQVAQVGYGARDDEAEYSIDRKQGAFLLVRKMSEANAVATCEAVLEEIKLAVQDPAFQGMDYFVFFNQSEAILATLGNLLQAGKWGGSLAVIVLFTFLRRIRPTALVAFSIPLSIVGALVFMFFAGMTLNIVTMIAMIIALGMLVDNSIVVIENIYRYQQMGYGPFESATRGATEVGLAITAATLTTLVVFIPTIYMQSGEMAIYMLQFAGPVTVSLLMSLLVALTLIPLVASRMRRREDMWAHRVSVALWRSVSGTSGARWTSRLAEFHLFNKLMDAYISFLHLGLRHRLASFAVLGVIVYFTFAFPLKRIGIQEMPTVDTRQVDIALKCDPNFDFEMTKSHVERVQSYIDELRDDLQIKNIWRNVSPSRGRLSVYLYQDDELPPGQTLRYKTEQVMNILWQKLPQRLPGVELLFSIPEATEGQSRSIMLRVKGDDARELMKHAEGFKALMEQQIDGIDDVRIGQEEPRQELQLQVDEPFAEDAGVSPFIIARTVDFALRGIRLPYVKQGGREVPVWAQFREEDRKTRENLDNVAVLTQRHGLIPLDRMVSLQKTQSPEQIQRVDGKNLVTITAKLTGSDMAAVMEQLRRARNRFELPRGYSIDFGDELMSLQTNMANFVTSIILSVILIYLVMGALFESFVLPLSILSTVPLAGIGVVWTMGLTKTSLDTIAFIGVILMVGIVVNNGIVIVDHINQLRREGVERTQAVLQGGRNRFRPVMMTALTTILGCVPLARGGELGAQVSFESLGRALIGGLSSGTLLTLIIVPIVYTLIDDMRVWCGRFLGDLLSIGRARAEVPAEVTVK